jgi:putative inorganic carbon (hco3(-)) transporter
LKQRIAPVLREEEQTTASGFGFALVTLFLIFEYSRPQDIVPVIGTLRPGYIFLLLLFIAWLRCPSSARIASPQITLMLLLAALLAIHIPFARNHYWAYEQTEEFVLLLLPLCVSIILFVDTRERLLSVFRWWVLLALYISVRTIIGHGVAGSNFLGDPNDVSLLLDTMLPFVLCMLVYEKRPLRRVTYAVIAVVCLAGIVITNSRGGFIGLVAVLAVIWLISPRKVLTLVLLCIVTVGAAQFVPKSYWDRMSSIQGTNLEAGRVGGDRNESTAEGRLASWRAAWEMFKDHPLGVGPNNFPIRFPEYQGKAFGRHGMWGRAAHSLWFTLLSELGIPGVILYALLLRANLRSLWRLIRSPAEEPQRRFAYLLGVAFVAGLAGFFAAGTFLSVLYYPHYWVLTALIVAAEKVLLPTATRQLGTSPVLAAEG